MSKHQKVCVITGANSGLGYETCEKMAALAYEVVLACRNQSKAKLAINPIKRNVPNAQLLHKSLDLISFESIVKFSKNFPESSKKRLQGTNITCNIVNPGNFIRDTSLFRNQNYF
ncbi:retinol dehydrogenase 12-like [Xenia sp. Carnegie-2017]|uniref:retinol dehydrogenase 12-like n=1 Tax=Xenia sp. Carnegie-2017 TaxID=2897299 RepID=UPI001F045A22|nr:retinol dehydrogenase 12-like [Xenia sp. Carnegie-2017]